MRGRGTDHAQPPTSLLGICRVVEVPSPTPALLDMCNVNPPSRWHCAHCPDFDLCGACLGRPEHAAHLANHAFLHLPTPIPRPLAGRPLLPTSLLFAQHHAAYARHHTQHVAAGPHHADIHSVDLEAGAMGGSAPGSPSWSDAVDPKVLTHPTFSGALCDGRCDTFILGARYTCVCCDDFDLCESCYRGDAPARAAHEGAHVFMRVPLGAFGVLALASCKLPPDHFHAPEGVQVFGTSRVGVEGVALPAPVVLPALTVPGPAGACSGGSSTSGGGSSRSHPACDLVIRRANRGDLPRVLVSGHVCVAHVWLGLCRLVGGAGSLFLTPWGQGAAVGCTACILVTPRGFAVTTAPGD
jgi:hypothetical protein